MLTHCPFDIFGVMSCSVAACPWKSPSVIVAIGVIQGQAAAMTREPLACMSVPSGALTYDREGDEGGRYYLVLHGPVNLPTR